MSSSVPYDPYVPPEESNSGANPNSQNKTAALRQEIDDTVGIMRDNINKVAERGERLTSIEDKADNLLSPHKDSREAPTGSESKCGGKI